MAWKKKLAVTIVLVIILAQNITPFANLAIAPDQNMPQDFSVFNPRIDFLTITMAGQPSEETDFTVHNPILIDGNLGFSAENGVTGGSGTPENPYIIEGWRINGSQTSNCIHIKNTDAYFIIRNVWVYEGNPRGIVLENVKNGIIRDSKTEKNQDNGIALLNSHCNMVSGNNITLNNGAGIAVCDSSNNTILDSIVSLNKQAGMWIWQCRNITVNGNNVESNGGQGICLSNSLNNTVEKNNAASNKYDGILSHMSSNNKILQNNAVSNNETGIRLDNSNFTSLQNNTVVLNLVGIQLYLGMNNTVMSNNASLNNGVGIGVLWSSHNLIARNKVMQNKRAIQPEYTPGIYLQGSNSNLVTGHVVSDNGIGICLGENCHNNTISGNIVKNNNQGVFLDSSCGNDRIYRNNCINNNCQAIDKGSNIWDYGEEGNYWSDYKGADLNNDGFGDSPYQIYEDSQDNFPSMSPYEIAEISAQILSCDIDSGSFKVGESVSVNVTLVNTGGVQWDFYIGFSVKGPIGKEWFDAPWTSIYLDAGASGIVSLSWQLVDSAPLGTYKARVAVWKGINYSTVPPLLVEMFDRYEKEGAFSVQTGSPISMIGASVKKYLVVPWQVSGYFVLQSSTASSSNFETAFRDRYGIEISKEGEGYKWKVALLLEIRGMYEFIDYLRFKWPDFFWEIDRIKDVLCNDRFYRSMLVFKFGGNGTSYMSSLATVIRLCRTLSKPDMGMGDPSKTLDLLLDMSEMMRNVFDVEWYFFKGSAESLVPHEIFSLGQTLDYLIDKLEKATLLLNSFEFVCGEKGIRYLLDIAVKVMASGCFSEDLDEATLFNALTEWFVDFLDLTLGHIWIKPTLWQQFVMSTIHVCATWDDPPQATMDLQVFDANTKQLMHGYKWSSASFS